MYMHNIVHTCTCHVHSMCVHVHATCIACVYMTRHVHVHTTVYTCAFTANVLHNKTTPTYRQKPHTQWPMMKYDTHILACEAF